jgi:hypothetical protein
MASNQNYKGILVGVFGLPLAENPAVVMVEPALAKAFNI